MSAPAEIEVSAPQEEILTSSCERNLFLAGVGSGKSHVLGLISADLVLNFPHVRGFIGANTHKQLSRSTLDRIFKVWSQVFGWKRGVDYVVNITPALSWIKYGERMQSYEGVISFNNGAVIFTSSLENYTAIDGTEFGWAMLDETKNTREEAVKEVIVARLRQQGMFINELGDVVSGETGRSFNPLYIATSPAKVDWINEWFDISDQDTIEEIHKRIFSETDYYSREKDNKKVVISSTYHNKHNLSSNYIDNLIADYKGRPNLLRMLLYASPVAQTGGEYITTFDRQLHVKACQFNKELPVHASFDFNVVPYNTTLCAHITRLDDGRYQPIIFAEICLQSPRNRTEETAKDAFDLYVSQSPGVFYTGDASGKNRTTVSTEHNFDVIERVFRKKIRTGSDRRFKRNPSVIKSRDFIIKLFAGDIRGIAPPIISPTCKNLIRDLEFMKEAPDGGYLKQHAKDENGGTYEKYGHCYDAFKYLMIATFSTIYENS